jgi:CRISPR/Cas system CSM-associated protein Csm4 (group 5 of RAMP superfamily)
MFDKHVGTPHCDDFTVKFVFTFVLVSRERTKRESLEREHKKLLKKANYLMQHYDSCLVDLARDVALMKGQIHDIQMEIATNVPSRDEMVLITNELATLKQQVYFHTKYRLHISFNMSLHYHNKYCLRFNELNS